MSDQNDDSQHYALMVLAGVVALVIAGVLALAISTTADGDAKTAPAAAAAPATESAPVPVPVPVSASTTAAAPAAEPDGRVYFESASEALPADAAAVLTRIKDAALASPSKVVQISGFHDASGDPAKNAELAKQRAFAVRDALVAYGVPLERLVLDKPAVTTGNGDAREARRVELRVR